MEPHGLDYLLSIIIRKAWITEITYSFTSLNSWSHLRLSYINWTS